MGQTNLRLQVLAPLEGDWISESFAPDGKKDVRKIQYRWLYDRLFFEGTSERETEDGRNNLRITYFYDVAVEQIKAWMIASDGATSEATVDAFSDRIMLNSRGSTSNGKHMSLKSILYFGNPRSEVWSEISIDGNFIPNPSPIQWTRL